MRSPHLKYSNFVVEMYSCVIKIAIDVIRSVLLVTTIPKLVFSLDNLDEVIAEPDPFKVSVKIQRIFFLFKLLYFFL